MIYIRNIDLTIYKFLSKSVIKYHELKHLNSENTTKTIYYKKSLDCFLLKSFSLILTNYIKNFFNIFNRVPFYIFEVGNVQIGKYVTSVAMRNAKAQYNFFHFFLRYHIYLIEACFVYASALRASKDARAIFLGDIYYLDGIWIDFFLPKENVDVYLKAYPYSLVCISKNYDNLDHFINNAFKDVNPKPYDYQEIKNYMERRLKKPRELIPYYDVDEIKYNLNYNLNNKINLIIYAHSFTDVQMAYGFDGFKNIFDWLKFTIKTLNDFQDVNIFLKVHPNMYRDKTASNIETMDQQVWKELKKIIPKNIKIIDNTVGNCKFLSFFKTTNTILITHHGNAVIEGAYLGFKVIASSASLWCKNYSFVNTWSNRYQYSLLLKEAFENIDNLASPDESLFKFINDCYLRELGLYSRNGYIEIISRISSLSVKELIRISNFKITENQEQAIITQLTQKSIELVD